MKWNSNEIKIIAIFAVFYTCHALESPHPEVLLQPRNFNPHPYTDGGRVPPGYREYHHQPAALPVALTAAGRRGPVLFPSTPGDDAQGTGAPLGAPIQDRGHPYAGVARKHKLKVAGRFSVDHHENNINPRVYSGLANYAAKVVKKTPASSTVHQQHNYGASSLAGAPDGTTFEDPSLAAHKKNYAFSYAVRDRSTGDDFSHKQSQNARATNGEYRVKLPDGRVQIVSYTADRNGYQAEVKYAEDQDNVANRKQEHDHRQQHQQPDYEYYDDPQVTQVEVPAYEPLQYHPEYVTIYPKHDDYKPIAHHKLSAPYVLTDKLHIYSTDSRHKLLRIAASHHQPQQQHLHADNYIESTLSPYTANNILDYEKNVGVSTATPARFSQVYITTPKYTLSHGSHHHEQHAAEYYKKR